MTKISIRIAYLILLFVTLLSLVQIKFPHPNLYLASQLLWFLAIYILIYEVLTRLKFSSWSKKNIPVLILIAFLTISGIAIRTISINSYPRVIEGDEGWTAMAAIKKLDADGDYFNHPFSFFQGFGRLHLDWFAASINLFGKNIFGLRFAQAISGSLAIPAIFLITGFAFGRTAGIGAALFTLLSNVHIHFSRTSAVGYMPGIWLSSLTALFLLKGLEKQNGIFLLLAAVFSGIHFNIYFDAIIFFAVLLIFFAFFLLKNKKTWKTIFLLWTINYLLPLFLLILPSLIWSGLNFDKITDRFNTEGTFQSGWFANEMAAGNNPFIILTGRVIHTFMSVFYLPMTSFYWSQKPFLDYLSSFLFFIGLYLLFKNYKKNHHLFLIIWLLTGILAIAIFAIPPESDGYRLLIIFPALAATAGLAWQKILTIPKFKIIGVLIFIIIGILNFKIYFIDFVDQCLYMGGYEPDRRWSHIGKYLSNNPYISNVHLQASRETHVYGTHPSVDFLSNNKFINVNESIIYTDIKGWHIFFVSPRFEDALSQYQTIYPGGFLDVITDCGKPTLYVYRTYL